MLRLITLGKSNDKSDESKEINNYYTNCKLKFNGPDKCLHVKLLDDDPIETLTVTFNRIFAAKFNLLCSMDQNFKKGMVFIFSNKEKCDQIFDGILKVQAKQPQPSNSTVVNVNDIFFDNYFLPLQKAVKSGRHVLHIYLHKFIDSLDEDDTNYFFNKMKEGPAAIAPATEEEVKERRQRKITKPTRRLPPSPEASCSPPKSRFSSSSNHRMPTRSFNDVRSEKSDEEEDDKENHESTLNLSNADCFAEPSPKNSSDDITFDIVESLHDGTLEKKLLVFTTKGRKRCYEFVCNRTTSRCINCFAQKKNVVIKATVHNDGSKTYNFDCGKHFCEPVEYVADNYQSSLIIESPNFQFVKRERHGKVNPLLIIFDSDDKSLCYKFGFDSCLKYFHCLKCKKLGRNLCARFIHHDGKNAVELTRLEHICEPQKYDPEAV